MRIITFSIMIFVSTTILSGQVCRYEKYFQWVGLATIDYHKGKFEEAKKEFKTAFKYTDFPLGVDLDIALKTAIKNRDTIWAEALSIKLAKGGIPTTYFDSLKNYAWYDRFKSNCLVYDSIYKNQFNLELKDQFLKLRFEDSLFNENYHKWRKGELDLTLQELIDGANGISNGFKSLISEHGFPCEQLMGYFFIENQIQSFPILVLLIHIYQRGEVFYRDRLETIVCDGKLKPTDRVVLNRIQGFGDGTGIEQEMKIRYERYRAKK